MLGIGRGGCTAYLVFLAVFVEEAPEAALGLALDLGQLVERGKLVGHD
jgi:hypothetical protein